MSNTIKLPKRKYKKVDKEGNIKVYWLRQAKPNINIGKVEKPKRKGIFKRRSK